MKSKKEKQTILHVLMKIIINKNEFVQWRNEIAMSQHDFLLNRIKNETLVFDRSMEFCKLFSLTNET